MKYIYIISNTVGEFKSRDSCYCTSMDEVKECIQKCSDWYRSNGTGTVYRIELNNPKAKRELIAEY